ncbi:hypothetical protein [Glutamicibacter protophormiae]|uniref:Minor tail protein n=1 Tax=Glutamicibacter protophormiae TaxID=37930 RepID=A0ABS4XQX0_GLUPR|nr:hypothetical protein [Glutamicibacter protophormiae]MBP2398916.1 hypothetical protein [Glutamicibacter protophormiae]GGL83567.1 hypothetical protein GCM10010038_11840 [Glutamicibacter protophormiae]
MTNLRDEARWLIGEISEAKRLARAGGKPQLANSAIEAGRIEEYDQDGTLVQIVGEQHDGTHTPVTVNGPVPPEPSAPAITAGIGSVEARWSGKFDSDALSPMDFSHVALHASRVEVFTPSNETQLATITGELGDVAVVLLEPGEWTFALVAVSKAGKWSEMSETVTVDVPDYPSPVDIQDELILLDEKYDGVITEAGNLGNRLDQAEEDLTAHEGRLGTAEQRVTEAFVQIDAADGKATAAAGVASAAQSKADTAAQAAADAAGIANGKGKVLVQSTAPGAADRNAVTLWIDTTGGANTPKRWTTGTTWVAVTDKAATDAAAAAAQAAQAAANAQSAAGSAQATANSALTMAGTKGKVFYSASTPSGTGTAEGDLWRRVDGSKNVIGEWYWSGSAWVSSQITTSAIANLDVGKLTVGTGVIADLVAQSIAASTAAFQTVDVKNLFVTTGTMTEAVINKLWSDVVMSRKITAQMVAIGSFENLVPSPRFEIPEQWTLVAGSAASAPRIQATGGRNDGPRMAIPSHANNSTSNPSALYSDGFVVEEDATYRMSAWWMTGFNSTAPIARLYVRFYSGSSYTSKLVATAGSGSPNVWSVIRGEFTVPAGTEFVRVAGASSSTSVWVYIDSFSLNRMDAGELTVDGSIKATKIDTEDLAANTGFIADLTARIVKSDMFVGKEFQGGTFTGSVFQTSGIASVGLKLDNQGLRVYGAEGGEPVTEIRANGGTVYSITDPATGDTLASLDRDGGVSGQELNIAGDPVFLGSPLLGDTVNFQHPSEFETPGLLDVLPRGMIARGFRNISDRTSVTNQEMEILEYNYVHEPGRGYRITVAPFSAYVGGGNAYGYLNVYVTTDGTRPSMSSTPTFRQYVRNQASGAELATFGGVFYNTGYQPAPRVVRIMITISSEGGTLSFHPNALASTVRTWVEDMGLSAPDTSIDRNGRMDLSVPTPVPPPEPPPVPKENYTQVWKATGYRSFDGNGRYTYADGTNKIYQGTAGYTGMLRSMVTFGTGSKGQTIVQALSGAKINSIKVTMRFDHWWSSAGGTAQIMLHGSASLTSVPPSMTLAATSSKWPKPGTRTVSIPSSRWEGFKNGDWKGIGLGNGSSGTAYYGYARASSVSLEIKYTK